MNLTLSVPCAAAPPLKPTDDRKLSAEEGLEIDDGPTPKKSKTAHEVRV
jgi:hypothetical protein